MDTDNSPITFKDLHQKLESVRLQVKDDLQARDIRLDKLETRVDLLGTQINNMTLTLQSLRDNSEYANKIITDFIGRMDKYLDRHDMEHNTLRQTDDSLKRYLFIAIGALGVLTFVAPYIWEVLWK